MSPARTIATLIVAVGLVAASGAQAGKISTDGWIFTNDTIAPNVTRSGNAFMLKIGVISLAKGSVTKTLTLNYNYVQRVLGSPSKVSPGPCSPSTITNKGNDCDQVVTRTTSLVISNLKTGERRNVTVKIGGATPATDCTVSGECHGLATISFLNNAGIRPTLKVIWTAKQNGDAEMLDVTLTNPKV